MNNKLSPDFRSHREQSRFVKLVSIATIFQMDPDWDEGVVEETRINCQKEADRLKFPHGWQACGSYEGLKQWFFQTYRHKEI